MKEFIVTGTKDGRKAMVRVFAYSTGEAMRKARTEHGFTSMQNTKLA
ncbi:hypothetical protein WNY81_11970 [Shewanella frigidimarina]